jgi:hypothetical protein
MKYFIYFPVIIIALINASCCNNKCDMNKSTGSEATASYFNASQVDSVINGLVTANGNEFKERITRGVKQTTALWTSKDGDYKQFSEFCKSNFEKNQESLFERINTNFEILLGNFNKMSLDLKKPLHIGTEEILNIDNLFGGFDPSSHLIEDLFQNKIAFMVTLNFPFYSLKEKTDLGPKWSRKEWAYARVGDIFTSRVPSELIQKFSEESTSADTYISEYNVFMGNLVNDKNETLFPSELKLISHWGLRDELKSNYNAKNGLEKQKMIYDVMKNIINQTIPKEVINNNKYKWNPGKNLVFENSKEIKFTPEPDTRYQHLLNIFKVQKEMDKFNPKFPTFIQRQFEGSMEIPVEDVEKLFISFISAPEVKQVAQLISKRLGRNLEPFDIWYDGFKARSVIGEDELNKMVSKKYPSKDSFEKNLPNLLTSLQFTKEEASFITSRVTVDASRGAGHAWGAQMKSDKAHLRTRIGKDGMNYKGYNIAVHEFGHNVEQTISLNNVDYYLLNGVPNTAFTEALAFVFQKRDLELLGIKNNDINKNSMMALDNFWSSYEIMGVSLVDIYTWKWLYKNPDATSEQLKQQVIKIATEVWNKYYADVFGIKDQIILAIYSHMIDAPLYLSNYPIGHVIDFQIDKQVENKKFGEEILRIYKTGRIIPQLWMKEAVGNELSVTPMLESVDQALKIIK